MLFLVFFPMIAAVLSYLIGRVSKGARDFFMMLSCGVTLAAVMMHLGGVLDGREYAAAIPGLCGFGLSFRLDGFRVLYALVGGVMWLMTALFSWVMPFTSAIWALGTTRMWVGAWGAMSRNASTRSSS